jgi:hypothetical protein
MSGDRKIWREVACEEDTKQLDGKWFTATVAGGRECRFFLLVNTGMNHHGNDITWISAWEIFGGLAD